MKTTLSSPTQSGKALSLLVVLFFSFISGSAQVYQNQNNPVLSNPIYFSGNTGDKISLYADRIGQTNMYGLGVGNLTSYSKTAGNYAWLQNTNVYDSDDQYEIYEKSLMHLTGGYTDGTILSLHEPVTQNAKNSGEIRFLEKSNLKNGGFMRYDGLTDLMHIGTYHNSGMINAITVKKSNGHVGIGVTNPTFELDLSGTMNMRTGLGPALAVNSTVALSYQANRFTWGAGASSNCFVTKVGIGTTNPHPDYMLSVNGKIRAKEIRVDTGWADFVFEPDYELPTLGSVEEFIAANGHLPGIPSAKQISEDGLDLGTVQTLMMQKIEELTLYVIELKKENEAMKSILSK